MALRKQDAENLSRRQRELELEKRVAGWSEFSNESRGFEWERNNYLTEYWGNQFQAACAAYIEDGGTESDLRAVHAVFVKYAGSHKRRYRVTMRTNSQEVMYRGRNAHFENVVIATDDDDLEMLSVETVTPQWEPSTEFATAMVEFFGIEMPSQQKQ